MIDRQDELNFRHSRQASFLSCQVLSTKNSQGISGTPQTHSYQSLNIEKKKVSRKECLREFVFFFNCKRGE